MGVTLTEDAVRQRRKTVTRRMGWRNLAVGDRLTLCLKVQGRRRQDGTVEPLVRLAEVQVVSVRREQLASGLTVAEVEREGFPGWDPDRFVRFFCQAMSCEPDAEVTRIEWRYLDQVEYLRLTERDVPCQVPHPQRNELACAHPDGHGVHWDGDREVWLGPTPDEERRGPATVRMVGRDPAIDAAVYGVAYVWRRPDGPEIVIPPDEVVVVLRDPPAPRGGPRLGLATTRQLLEEIKARGVLETFYRQIGSDMANGAANLMESLPGSMLDYSKASTRGGDQDGAQASEPGRTG